MVDPLNAGPKPNGDYIPFPAWLKAIVTLGVPGAIAVFLVWVGSQELPRLNREALLTHAEVVQLKDETRAVLDQLQINYRMLQRLCANTAKNDDDRNRCFDK
jgi:hypothetical protein